MNNRYKLVINRDNIFMVSFYLMIFSQIFNTNRFVAAIRFTMIPTILAVIICIVCANWQIRSTHITDYWYLIVVGLITAISVVTSNIVGWTANVTSFYVYLALFILMTIRDLTRREIKRVVRFYLLLCLIISTQILINVALSRNYSFGRVSFSWLGVIKDQNIVSAFLAFGAFISFTSYLYNKKMRFLIAFLFVFIAMLFDGSRGGTLTVLLSSVILLIKWLSDRGSSLRKIVVICFLATVAGGILVFSSGYGAFGRVLTFQNYTQDSRLALWRYALRAFYNRPLIGSGYDSGSFYSGQYWNAGSPTHNSFIDLLTSVGIMGCICYLIFVIKRWKVLKDSNTFLVSTGISLLLPLLFINGYGTITFMMPCVLVSVIATYCKKNSFADLLM